VVQQARNFTFHLDEREDPLRFLIHDRDSKFCRPFDDVFATEGLQMVRTPSRHLVLMLSASDGSEP
jgi:putative transposase